jgi:murein L,D-transpeptidase YcbB/YkuD
MVTASGRRRHPGAAGGLLLLAACLLFLLPKASSSGQGRPPIQHALEHLPPPLAHMAFEEFAPSIQTFYERREHRPVWTDAAGRTPAGESLLRALQRANEDGLNPENYLVSSLAVPASADPAAMANLEILMSFAAARLAHDVGWGVTRPAEVDPANSYEPRAFDAGKVLETLAAARDPEAALGAYAPQGIAYRLVKEALRDLRAIASGPGWTTASAGTVLRSGDRGPRVQELRTLLVERGDLEAALATGDLFDADVAAALTRFQRRHGLDADGVYGPAVAAELNVPISMRIQQVRLGLERLRWLPSDYSGRRVGVNLADYKAYLVDGEQLVFETRTVIGKEIHETPMFTGMMTYLVINPYWNVPASIAQAEILPKARKDPGYLTRNHMEIVDGSVRQLPGPSNSLGRFKFMFPNRFNVYLHDTPARALFERSERAFSHGCIRLEKPAELAALLLAGQGWTPERIAATVESGESTTVQLETPVAVNISYVTAFRAPDGLLHYRRDVYGRDRKLLEALERQGEGRWDR